MANDTEKYYIGSSPVRVPALFERFNTLSYNSTKIAKYDTTVTVNDVSYPWLGSFFACKPAAAASDNTQISGYPWIKLGNLNSYYTKGNTDYGPRVITAGCCPTFDNAFLRKVGTKITSTIAAEFTGNFPYIEVSRADDGSTIDIGLFTSAENFNKGPGYAYTTYNFTPGNFVHGGVTPYIVPKVISFALIAGGGGGGGGGDWSRYAGTGGSGGAGMYGILDFSKGARRSVQDNYSRFWFSASASSWAGGSGGDGGVDGSGGTSVYILKKANSSASYWFKFEGGTGGDGNYTYAPDPPSASSWYWCDAAGTVTTNSYGSADTVFNACGIYPLVVRQGAAGGDTHKTGGSVTTGTASTLFGGDLSYGASGGSTPGSANDQGGGGGASIAGNGGPGAKVNNSADDCTSIGGGGGGGAPTRHGGGDGGPAAFVLYY